MRVLIINFVSTLNFISMAIPVYNFPDHERGTTFGGLQFELIINSIPTNLVGATINMKIAGKIFSTITGEFIFSDAANGKFQFKEQVINLSPKTHPYELEFIFADGTVKVYQKGTWRITD
jgi:hypothetical protein